MIRIRNASGLLLELRCRRDKQGEEGAVVQLEDGDVIDDSMGAFDALNLRGELKKALTSLNLGETPECLLRLNNLNPWLTHLLSIA